jgi:hypothetical protein
MNDRGLVCTMLGWVKRGDEASRGERAPVLVLQCWVRGRRVRRSEPWVNVCSGFLEGNEELGAVNALFSVGLSASSNLYAGAMRATLLVLWRAMCGAGTGYRDRRLAPGKLFADCTVGVSMYMLVYRSRCPEAAQSSHRRARTAGQREERRAGGGGKRVTGDGAQETW